MSIYVSVLVYLSNMDMAHVRKTKISCSQMCSLILTLMSSNLQVYEFCYFILVPDSIQAFFSSSISLCKYVDATGVWWQRVLLKIFLQFSMCCFMISSSSSLQTLNFIQLITWEDDTSWTGPVNIQDPILHLSHVLILQSSQQGWDQSIHCSSGA